MKTISMVLGLTGSVIVLMFAVQMAFLGHGIVPAGSVYRFNPDAFILFLSGLLGIFGGLIGAAGSMLCLWDSKLSGIMLFGAAVSGAVMFGAVIALFLLAKIRVNEYAVFVAGIIAFSALTVSGVLSLKARRREPINELGNGND